MATSDERIAKGIEALARIAEDVKAEWRADRDAQAHESNRGLLDVNTMMPLKTAGGRLVGYAFPNEAITVHEGATKGQPVRDFVNVAPPHMKPQWVAQPSLENAWNQFGNQAFDLDVYNLRYDSDGKLLFSAIATCQGSRKLRVDGIITEVY